MFQTFCEDLVANIQVRVGDNHDVRIHHVVKNNGLELDGIVVRKKEDMSAPTIYINDYYNSYLKGVTVDDIAGEILSILQQEEDNPCSVFLDNISDFEKTKGSIFYRLVNFEQNKEELSKIPHIPYLDLAITFHCLVKCEVKEVGTIKINRQLLEHWAVSVNQLWEIAKENTPRLFPVQIRNMSEVIFDILETKGDGVEICKEVGDSFPSSDMYVFTNQAGINGASVLLYEEVLSSFASYYQSDFYILPSSIHEVILVPVQKKYTKHDLCDMVHGVNATQVAREDILSNSVYIYHRKENRIRM